MDGLAMIEKVILSVITVVVTVVTFANVVVRYASDSQFAWSEELVINLFVLMIMMGCALCAREGSLISLSLIFDFLKKRGIERFHFIIFVHADNQPLPFLSPQTYIRSANICSYHN